MDTIKVQERPKDGFWQAIRGICIIAVVMIHCAYPADINYATWEKTYYIIWRNVLNFPVSVFAFMAGYFVKKDVSFRLSKRLLRLLVPYLVYSCAYFAFGFCAGTRFTPREYLVRLLSGGAATPFYYIVMLSVFTLFTPMLIKCLRLKIGSILILSISPVLMCFMTLLETKLQSPVLYLLVLDCGMWISFYYGGLLVRDRKFEINISKAYLYGAVVLALILEIVSTVILLKSDFASASYSQKRITGIIYSVCVILLFLRYSKDKNVNRDTFLFKKLIYVGDRSYGIFYIHCAVLLVLRMVLGRLNIVMPLLLLRATEFVIAFAGSLVVVRLIKLVFRKSARIYFGI